MDRIGQVSTSGQVTGNFAADPGEDIQICHGLGATMWIRSEVLTLLGGFREYFPGTAACEDTDLFLRARRLGYQAWFVHRAVVQHVAAPQEGGQRFDLRYTYWAAHNGAILFMADDGALAARFWLIFLAAIGRNLAYGGRWYRRAARTALVVFAWLRGVAAGYRLFGFGPQSPIGIYRRP